MQHMPKNVWPSLRRQCSGAQARPGLDRASLVGSMQLGTPQDDYIIGKQLGAGAFGVAHMLTHKVTGQQRVMKSINTEEAAEMGMDVEQLKKEIDIMAELDHPHILSIFGYYQDDMHIHMIMDFCGGGELMDLVQRNSEECEPLPEDFVRRIFFQILQAIAYCHSKGVVHRDLKFQNIMFQKRVAPDSPIGDIHAIVIDVGLAEKFRTSKSQASVEHLTEFAGSFLLMSPQVLQQSYTYKADIWSLGCLMYAAFNTRPNYCPDGAGGTFLAIYPFIPTEEDPMGTMQAAQQAGPDFEAIPRGWVSPEAQNCITRMLQYEEETRPDCTELLALPWFETDVVASTCSSGLSAEQLSVLMATNEHQRLWDVVMATAAVNLPSEKLQPLEALFQRIDIDHDGTVSAEELRKELSRHGLSSKTVDVIFRHMDIDGTGEIERRPFVAAMLPATADLFPTALLTAFAEFDTDRGGELDRNEFKVQLQRCAARAGLDAELEDDDNIFDLIDIDNSGSISYKEFERYFLGKQRQRS